MFNELSVADPCVVLTAAMNGNDNAKADKAEMYHEGTMKHHHQLEIIKTLGEGTHGKVVLATDPVSMQQVRNIGQA